MHSFYCGKSSQNTSVIFEQNSSVIFEQNTSVIFEQMPKVNKPSPISPNLVTDEKPDLKANLKTST
jgi:hypothetical protein